MASANASSPGSASAGAEAGFTPAVRLEVRPAAGPPTTLDVSDLGFLVGSVPGCDLRVPGANLPPVLALITRHADGPHLRRLMPTHPVLLNGRPAASGRLADGDRLTVAGVEL